MIVKLWPIRGTKGLKDCTDYVRDDTKVTSFAVNEDGTISRMVYTRQDAVEQDAVEEANSMDNVIAYVSNPAKTEADERTYVSGYHCHPDHVTEQFEATRKALGVLEVGPGDVTCYHMVQSFPQGLDISPEEAHQCGLELLEKLGAHQGIVCTHVNPVADEDGVLHGEQMHNHIVFNAYKLPDCIDPEHPKAIKYNRCNDSYEQLQCWNDEIAFDHGLPIVAELDASKLYDWGNPDQPTQKWRDRMRYDIQQVRNKARDWDDFVKRMGAAGYSIRDGETITYHAPDGVHKARGAALGKDYTKNGLLLYWALRLEQQKAIAQAARAGKPSPFRQVYNAAASPLYIQIPIADSDSIYRLPLDRKLAANAIDSYFVAGRLYDVVDADGAKVYTATGDEAKALLLSLMREREQGREQEEEIKRRVKAMEHDRQELNRDIASDEKARRSPYAELFVNENGKRKNTLELSFVVASLLLGKQFGLENKYTQAAEKIADQRHARDLRRQSGPDRRLQMMVEGMTVIKQEGFQSEEDMNKAVNRAGWAYNKAKKALTRTQERIQKLEPLLQAFDDYEDTHEIAAMLQAMDDGPEKQAALEQHAELMDRYNAARRTMYGFKTPPERIDETRERVKAMRASLPELEDKLDAAKADLRKMKRTQYAFRLSHSNEYLAGRDGEPIQGPEKSHTQTRKHDTRDAGR